jgi:hypothetical protein
VVPVLLLGSVISGGVDGAGVKAVAVLLFSWCFELGALALPVKRYSQAT